VQFFHCQVTCSIKHDKHFVYSTVTRCLNPPNNTSMSRIITVRELYHLDQHQCTHLQLFQADMYITRVYVHTNTHVASIQCNTTRQHTPIVHKDKELTCALFQWSSDWSPLHSFLISLVHLVPLLRLTLGLPISLSTSPYMRAHAHNPMHTIPCYCLAHSMAPLAQ
jgi:hypothetical protein